MCWVDRLGGGPPVKALGKKDHNQMFPTQRRQRKRVRAPHWANVDPPFPSSIFMTVTVTLEQGRGRWLPQIGKHKGVDPNGSAEIGYLLKSQ